jgi:hypothetical protein
LFLKRLLLGLERLRKEPRTALRLVDPGFQDARRRNVATLIAACMSRTHKAEEPLIVLVQLTQHGVRKNSLLLTVIEPPEPRYIPNRVDCSCPELTRTLGDFVGHRKELFCLIVEQKMIVTEMRSAHMPMEVLGFEIKREYIRQQRLKIGFDRCDRTRVKICARGYVPLVPVPIFFFSFHSCYLFLVFSLCLCRAGHIPKINSRGPAFLLRGALESAANPVTAVRLNG